MSPHKPILTVWAALLLAAGLQSQAVNRPDPVLNTRTWEGQTVVADVLLVAFEAGTASAQRLSVHESVSLGPITTISRNLDRVSLPAGTDLDVAMARYADLAGVRAAQPDVLLQPVDAPNDPYWMLQWGPPKVSATEAWEVAPGDADCVIAIIDSGVLTSHVDLDERYAWGYDFYANDSNPTDTHGHGTHCAGIAAAEADNGVGVAGVANGCRYAAYRAGNGSFPSSSLVASIDDAVEQGAQVLSMSWGSASNNILVRFALEDAADAGCVLVAAAGNDNTSQKFYPAALDEVIAVASSSPSDGRSSFSNYGSWVSVAAPGQSIYSTAHTGAYVYKSGTSMACPLVAGMAGLLYARLGGTRSPANAAAVRAALEDSALPVGAWVEHGRVDLLAATNALTTPESAELQTISGSALQSFGGETLTLTGSGFVGVEDVLLDGQSAASLRVLTEDTLEFVTPAASLLGWQDVQLLKNGQLSNALMVQVQDNDPPRFTTAAQPSVGDTLKLSFGGGANAQWLLLASLSDATVPFRGSELLYPFKLLTTHHFDPVGLAELNVNVPASLSGLVLSLQIAALESGNFVGTSEVRTIEVLP
ncbi:MAG: hypothetical protein DHS20C15_21720 [Planctomycetota bacterium]|nr:MAG: hypothetical protein DHS20C15_21720 [Planctomycetota bacterium]